MAEKLNELSPAQKSVVKKEVIKSFMKRETKSLLKRRQRMPKLSSEDHQAIIQERERMWRDRIQKVFNL